MASCCGELGAGQGSLFDVVGDSVEGAAGAEGGAVGDSAVAAGDSEGAEESAPNAGAGRAGEVLLGEAGGMGIGRGRFRAIAVLSGGIHLPLSFREIRGCVSFAPALRLVRRASGPMGAALMGVPGEAVSEGRAESAGEGGGKRRLRKQRRRAEQLRLRTASGKSEAQGHGCARAAAVRVEGG